MDVKKLLVLIAILLLLPFAISIKSQTFGQGQSLYTDIKAHQIGDILSVNIVERNDASTEVESKTSKKSNSSTSGGPGIGTLDFFPMFGASAKSNHKFDGKGEQSRSGDLTARMSVTVVGIKPNGDLIIEGTRVLGISNDKEVLTLTGVVRTKDITADNSIESYLIADAEIMYTGKGVSTSGSRPGFLNRIFSWIF